MTFLGAHIVPEGAVPQEYLDLVTGEMLDAVAPHVRAIDVLCERGAFDAEAADRILVAGAAWGLALHVHGNQLGPGPGVQVAVRHGAASVDHVNFLNERDVAALADSWDGERRGTVAPVLQMGLSVREPSAERSHSAGTSSVTGGLAGGGAGGVRPYLLGGYVPIAVYGGTAASVSGFRVDTTYGGVVGKCK